MSTDQTAQPTETAEEIYDRRMARINSSRTAASIKTDAPPASSTRPTQTLPTQSARPAPSPEPADEPTSTKKPAPEHKQKFVYGEDGYTRQELWAKKWFRVTTVLVAASMVLLLIVMFITIGWVSVMLIFTAVATFFAAIGCCFYWKKQAKEAEKMEAEMKLRTDMGKKAKPKMILSYQTTTHHRDQNLKRFKVLSGVFAGSAALAILIHVIMILSGN